MSDESEPVISNNVNIQIFDSPENAPNYREINKAEGGEYFKAGLMDTVRIVRNGTVQGNDTVDLQILDGNGNVFIVTTTARIIKQIADMCITSGESIQ